MEDRRPQLLPLISESAKHLSLPRMKLLCSYAGKLLARPDDGRLRYSGGEKRIIAVNRDITYSDLMLRVLEIYGQTVELKYQPLDEDPDALVSLRSDEDIANMMDEHDLKRRGSRIRVFLLSSIDQPQGDSSKEQTNSSFPSESVGGGLTSDAVKSCKSATSDRLRELDARRPSSIPSLSSDALSSSERQSQLSFNLTTSQTRLQSDSVERSLPSSSISETPLKQTALSGCSSSICSKEQACVTSRVQLSCSSAENKYFDSQRLLHWLSSGTEDDAAEQCLQSSSVASAEVAKLEQCATNSQEVLSKLSSSAPISNHKVAPIQTFESLAPENQVETLAAESHSLINPNIDNSEDINATKCFTPGDVDAQQESLKSSQCLASFSIVGCKSPDKQHHKYLIDWQVVSSLPLHDLDSQVRSVSLAPPVGRLELESYVGIPQPNDDKSKSVWSSNPLSLTVDILSSPQELICRQQDFASANNTLLNVVGAFDTVTVTHHHDLENMLTSTVSVIVPDYPAQMEAGSFLEHQQIAEPNTLSLPEDKKNQPVTSGDQQDKVFLSKVHPTHHVQTSNLPSEEGKEMDWIGFCLQRERNARDDFNMLGKTDAGLIEPNYLDLKSAQQLEAFHDVRAKMTNFNGNMHLTSVNLIAQCTEAHNEQLEKRLGSNDLVPENSYFGPEKHPLLPSVLELNKLDAKLSYPVLAKSRSLDKVGTLEKLQTSCIGLPTSVDLAPENLYHELRTANLMREAQTVENILAGGGAMSKNSSDKDEYLQCKETIKKDVQLRKTVLNESYAESTAEANVIAPPICMPSSIATKTFTMNISPLLCSSKIENKVDSCHSGREDLQEGLNDTDMTASSEIHATCKTSASEQMERWEDTKKLKDALPNEAFHEDVELEVNAEVMKEDSTCRSMIFKPEDDKCSNIFMAAFDAEVEATARGLQIIRNADLEERRELGSGNFGTVYHGKWKGSDVAIKRIKSSCFDGSPSVRERLKADFWKETGILAEMHHPNVVAFYGVVPDGPDGTLAMVTEFMVNGSLKHVLRKKIVRVLDPRRRLFIAMDSAFGMEYLHNKNIVHFDLKSENLFVNVRDPQRPICKVGDFGLSKVKQRTLVSGGFRGTLPWIAPELLNGSSMVTEKVDVYSFGIVMWELLTGEEPYADYHYGAVLGGILSDTLRPSVPEKCDPAWRLLMERCWSSDPINRPCFSEISSALRLMAASQLVKVQRPTQLQEGTGILQECVH